MARFPDGTILLYKPDYKSVSVDVTTKELIKCKNCKHYTVEDVWSDIDGVPILAANQVPTCKRWANGCMTESEGYCFMAERKDDDDGR